MTAASDRELETGRQAYIVYPVIEESEKTDLKAATKERDRLALDVFPDASMDLVSAHTVFSSILDEDLRRGLAFAESVRTGWVNVNEGTNYWESHLPFGGRAGSASGVGRVGGRFSMERLTELKTIVIDLG